MQWNATSRARKADNEDSVTLKSDTDTAEVINQRLTDVMDNRLAKYSG